MSLLVVTVARRVLFAITLSVLAPLSASAAEWFVAPGSRGDGSAARPFGRVQDAIAAARAGDVVTLAAGTYTESVLTVRDGTATAPITLRAATPRTAVITRAGRVLLVKHAWFVVDGLVLDGQYGDADLVRVEAGGRGFALRGSELRRTSRDAVDIGAAEDVLIERSLIHHALNAAGGRTDAHGVVAGAVRRLTIRGTEIHTFSGDGVQVDPGRDAPGWSDVLIDGCRIWLAPLPAATNGFAAGTVPGENALDTKASAALPRASIRIVDTEAFGFRNGLISNMAAFNVKENVDAAFDRVTVHGSEIAFRLRGPGAGAAGARVRVQNAVVHSSSVAFRYEDDIRDLRIWNSTLGTGVIRPFVEANASPSALDVRNLLLLGKNLPVEAAAAGSNLAVDSAAFRNAAGHDYRLAAGSPAVDAGESIAAVATDRDRLPRPAGLAFDIGAYERPDAALPSEATGGEVVFHAAHAGVIAGRWKIVADSSAAGGFRVTSPDRSQPLIGTPLAAPRDYIEVTFAAEAGTYRVWLRGRAKDNATTNDSVHAQFSDAVNGSGQPLYRIGSASAGVVELAPCNGCTPDRWGWQSVAGDGLVTFTSAGPQTLRIQVREDGMSIDQIVLSSARYLTQPPGAARNDRTILPEER